MSNSFENLTFCDGISFVGVVDTDVIDAFDVVEFVSVIDAAAFLFTKRVVVSLEAEEEILHGIIALMLSRCILVSLLLVAVEDKILKLIVLSLLFVFVGRNKLGADVAAAGLGLGFAIGGGGECVTTL